ncbi:MAG: hypothetical protein ACRER2_11230, partial [Methylococcales bacterium]
MVGGERLMIKCLLISKMFQPTPKSSFRQGLPESRSHGWQWPKHIPVFWISAIPADMTAELNHLANQE